MDPPGAPLTTAYEGDHSFRTVLPYSGEPGFSYPLLLGLLSIVFSLCRGLVFFMPALLLWLSDRTPALLKEHAYAVGLMLLVVCGLVLVYARWWAWYGGISCGPRFFVFARFPRPCSSPCVSCTPPSSASLTRSRCSC